MAWIKPEPVEGYRLHYVADCPDCKFDGATVHLEGKKGFASYCPRCKGHFASWFPSDIVSK